MKITSHLKTVIEAIDVINSADPHQIRIHNEMRPKELAHAAMVSAWIDRLRPDADDALRIAAHGHHIRRWTIPRSNYPAGRRGYLRWRQALQELHAATLAGVMTEIGFDKSMIRRVQDIVRKKNLRCDADVQALEDALCLVFLETQLSEMRSKHPNHIVVNAVRKTWCKMSTHAQALANDLDLPPDDQEFLAQALEPGSS